MLFNTIIYLVYMMTASVMVEENRAEETKNPQTSAGCCQPSFDPLERETAGVKLECQS